MLNFLNLDIYNKNITLYGRKDKKNCKEIFV